MTPNPWDERFEAVLRANLPSLPPHEQVQPDISLRDAGLDSMKITGLLVALEDAYGGVVPDDELTFEAFGTPGALWQLISRVLPVSDPPA